MGWDCAGNGNRWSGDRVCLFGEDQSVNACYKEMRNWSIDVNVLFEIQILVDLEICSILKKNKCEIQN